MLPRARPRIIPSAEPPTAPAAPSSVAASSIAASSSPPAAPASSSSLVPTASSLVPAASASSAAPLATALPRALIVVTRPAARAPHRPPPRRATLWGEGVGTAHRVELALLPADTQSWMSRHKGGERASKAEQGQQAGKRSKQASTHLPSGVSFGLIFHMRCRFRKAIGASGSPPGPEQRAGLRWGVSGGDKVGLRVRMGAEGSGGDPRMGAEKGS